MEGLGFRYAGRELTRSLLTACGVAAALVLSVFAIGVYRGAVDGSLQVVEQAGADVWVGPRGSWNLLRTSGFLPRGAIEVVAGARGVRDVRGILCGLVPAEGTGDPRTLLAIGLEPGEPALLPPSLVSGRTIQRRGEAVVDVAFARRARLWIDEEVIVAGRSLRIVGVSRHTNLLVTQFAFVPIEDLRELLGLAEQHSFLLVKAGEGVSPADLAESLRRETPAIAAFDAATFLANNRRETARGFLPVLWTVALLGLFAGAAVVALMSTAAALEKRADYALLAALGFGWARRAAVAIEQALAAAAAGGVLALALLVSLPWFLERVVPEVEFHLEIGLVALVLAGTLVMAVAGALVPAWLSCRVPPMEAFRR